MEKGIDITGAGQPKKEQEKMCPLSFVFNMAAMVPGNIGSRSSHIMCPCMKEMCQLWVPVFGQERTCAFVKWAQK
jgi:hypothetical protein